jgi:Mechanosensitive ion channel
LREAPEVLESLEVGTVPHRYPLKGWVIGILAGAITLAALIIGSSYGDVHAKTLNPKLVAWISAAVIVLAGIVATTRLSTAISHLVGRQNAPAFEGAVKFISAAVGYLFVSFAALAVLDVSVERLLVGAGLAGVVLGIAAQQSLGNIFAGLVLILARPFVVGDHIRIRSGALGGIFDVWVLEMSLTYVTVRTDDGQLKIPNTAMLAAGVGKIPPEGLPSKPVPASPAQATPAPGSAAPAAPAQPGLISNDGGQAPSAQSVVVQTGGPQTGGPQTGQPQAGQPQAGGPQAGQPQASEPEQQ